MSRVTSASENSIACFAEQCVFRLRPGQREPDIERTLSVADDAFRAARTELLSPSSAQ